MRSNEAIFKAKNIHKSFGKTKALDGIDIDITAGESIAVMGPSGSGKSTLLHGLAGIIPVDSGTIQYKSADMIKLSDDERTNLRRTDFGFVFQFGQLLSELSALDNVALPLLLGKRSREEAYKEARELLDELSMGEYANNLVGSLSGGQAQRVAIARALVHKPAVVFADEPTGSLDSLNSEKVMELLTGYTKKLGTTLVVITHDSKVAAYCERMVIVRDGKISNAEGKAA